MQSDGSPQALESKGECARLGWASRTRKRAEKRPKSPRPVARLPSRRDKLQALENRGSNWNYVRGCRLETGGRHLAARPVSLVWGFNCIRLL